MSRAARQALIVSLLIPITAYLVVDNLMTGQPDRAVLDVLAALAILAWAFGGEA